MKTPRDTPHRSKLWIGITPSGSFNRLFENEIQHDRYTRDRKLSVMTDISGPQNIPPNEPSAETNMEGESPVTDQQPAEIPNPSPTPDDWKSDPPTTDEPTLQTSSNELPDGATPEITRGNRSPTLSSTSSAVTKSSTPITQKYVTELIESHIFLDSSSKNHPSEHSDGTLTDVEELCGRAFADQYGMDLFLQVLDEKRGRCAELEVLGFHNMKVAMKVWIVSTVSLMVGRYF